MFQKAGQKKKKEKPNKYPVTHTEKQITVCYHQIMFLAHRNASFYQDI